MPTMEEEVRWTPRLPEIEDERRWDRIEEEEVRQTPAMEKEVRRMPWTSEIKEEHHRIWIEEERRSRRRSAGLRPWRKRCAGRPRTSEIDEERR